MKHNRSEKWWVSQQKSPEIFVEENSYPEICSLSRALALEFSRQYLLLRTVGFQKKKQSLGAFKQSWKTVKVNHVLYSFFYSTLSTFTSSPVFSFHITVFMFENKVKPPSVKILVLSLLSLIFFFTFYLYLTTIMTKRNKNIMVKSKKTDLSN